ncbi:MAG: hypothetical protein PHH11_10610 [Methylomonas sp.]|nr:hypothetical protein [Methylomonas sp.]
MSTLCARLVAAFCLLLPALAGAACRDESAVHAAIASGYEPDDISLIACKAMPERPGSIVVAFINEVRDHTYTLTVLVLTKATGQVRFRFVDDDPSFGPNGDPSDVQIDTGRYWLASNKRAFGIRVKHSLNPWDSTEDLNLFIPTENKLSRVLKELTVASSSGRACELGSHQMTRTLSIAKSTSYGLYDLFINTMRLEVEPTYGADGQCSSRETTRADSVRLQYTGDSYAYPPDFY